MRLTKRDLLAGAAVSLAAPLILKTAAFAASPTSEAVTKGLTYLQDRAATQAVLCRELTAAIASGDFEAARAAYGASRPPYEEIEVHAGAFADIDSDIDARAYAFAGGETSDGFKGFHRIEALLFRDRDLAAALPVAQELERSISALSTALTETDRFSDKLFFEGLIALPEEVASKKISSEEETWSDLSLVIFRHNFIGVQSQYAGYAARVEAKDAVAYERAQLAFLQAQSVLEPYFEGGGVTRYSDVRAFERGAIVKAAYDIRAAMEQSAQVLGLI